MKHAAVLAVTALCLTPVTACGGSGDDASKAHCEAAGSVASVIEPRLNSGGSVKASQAVRAPDRKNAYYVALTFSATGIEDQTGVWVTNDLNDPATIMSVDGTAKRFSDYPDGSAQDFSLTDEGAKQARACVGG